jgi:predicted secreted hydrolase
MDRRVLRRTAITALALCVLGAGAAFAADIPPLGLGSGPVLRPVSLPRDHGAHPGFGVEWWYTAGTLHGSDGHRYFWFATAWAAAQGVVSRANVLDLNTGQIVLRDESLVTTPLRAGQRVLRVGRFTIALQRGGRLGRWIAADTTSTGERLALTLTPQVPYLLHGHRGLIAQGPGARSAYYSEPRLGARGTLRLDGAKIALSGLGWLDHQWGNFAASPGSLRWNWFACQLRDGRDLMLYEFLDAQDRPSGVAAGTLVTQRGAVVHLHAFRVTPLSPSIKPPGATSSYPQRWRLHVPGARLTLALHSLTPDGFIANAVLPSFWEAPAAVTGGPAGACIVESSREV